LRVLATSPPCRPWSKATAASPELEGENIVETL